MANKKDKGIRGEISVQEENSKESEETEEKLEEMAESEEPQAEGQGKQEESSAAEAEAETEVREAPLAEAKEEKPPSREKKEKEEEIVEERTYTVPLGKAWIMPPRKRTPRAIRMLRTFVVKHMKLEAVKEGEATEEEEEPKNLVISNEVNEKMWERGVEKPPRKIRIKAAKDKDGNITVYLAEGD
jgi:large subunit ribosomal protein L31e